MLDAPERAAQHERRDGDRRRRHTDPARNAGHAERGGDARELPAERPEVRPEQRDQRHERPAHAEPLADQADQALPVTIPIRAPSSWKMISATVDAVDDPEQRVAVVRAEDRVGRDAGRVIVREPGEQPGSEDREQGGEAGAPAHRRNPLWPRRMFQ